MLRKIKITVLALPLLCSILLISAFPNFQFSILAWFALIPLFFVVINSPRKRAFLLSYLAGIIFYAATLYWLIYVTKPGYVVLVLILALFFALFGLLSNIFFARFSASRSSFLLGLLIPSIWVGLEFIRGFLFTGFPWAILGYTQYKNLFLIQIADITGAYGVSFLIVMTNFAIYACLLNLFKRNQYFHRVLLLQVIPSIIILAAVMSYGYFTLNETDVKTGLHTTSTITH
ncbi:MAG: hypothetical protein L0922_04940, partial [Candidatus Mariimomonas ferrooxydans]